MRARRVAYTDANCHAPIYPINGNATMTNVCNSPTRPNEMAAANALSEIPVGALTALPNALGHQPDAYRLAICRPLPTNGTN